MATTFGFGKKQKAVTTSVISKKPAIATVKYCSKNDLPSSESLGTLLITTDTLEMFMGSGENKPLKSSSDIIIVQSFGLLPQTGVLNKLYVCIDTGVVYYWNGAEYMQIAGGSGGTIVDSKIFEYDTIANFPATGVAKALYIDKTTNFVYRYDTQTNKYVKLCYIQDIDARLTNIEAALSNKADTATLANYATKIELTNIQANMATKADLTTLATKAELSSMQTNMATKSDLTTLATKTELTSLQINMATKSDLTNLATALTEIYSILGDAKANPQLLTELQKIDTNVLAAIIKIYNELIALKNYKYDDYQQEFNVTGDTPTHNFVLKYKPTGPIQMYVNGMLYDDTCYTYHADTNTVEWTYTEADGGFDIIGGFNVVFIYKVT